MTETRPTVQELQAEARALHRVIFGAEPTPQMVERYVAAHAAGLGACSVEASSALQHALRNGVDLAALELVLRRRNGAHPLVRKFRIMTYIGEGTAGYDSRFVSRGGRRVHPFAELFSALFRSAWKMIKGRRLLRRYL